ncbi:MAG: hypothetical protein ACN6NI_09250 [Acinetobacter sp.]
MPILILKAKSKRCFDPKVLMVLIECLPENERPAIKELLTFYPEEIKLSLTSEVWESTIPIILERLNGVFIISE